MGDAWLVDGVCGDLEGEVEKNLLRAFPTLGLKIIDGVIHATAATKSPAFMI